MLSKYIRLFNTVKYLKYSQIKYRIVYKFKKPKPTIVSGLRPLNWCWDGPNISRKGIFGKNKVRFLNEFGEVNEHGCWNNTKKSKLWLYNLHYFDDLNSGDWSDRIEEQNYLLNKWIDDNPPCLGNGWEPYPISLRLVNWVKWLSRQENKNQKFCDSLMIQTDALRQQIEYHILGNHLFANAKALIFVGCYFSGEQAHKFLETGLSILKSELKEQFLSDGAHFELSPMYNNILLWDVLELLNLARLTNNPMLSELEPYLKQVAEASIFWSQGMNHPDNEVSFFNDSAMNLAPSLKNILSLAESLRLDCKFTASSVIHFEASGYSRVEFKLYTMLVDHAAIGPDYLPGHGHADTLSFELSAWGKRVFVNSGISVYGVSPERVRQRGTAAHNTVTVAHTNSSEVWSGFRVARRAKVKLERHEKFNDNVYIRCSHDGYTRLKNGAIHTREFLCGTACLEIKDTVKHGTDSIFHLHLTPDVDVQLVSDNECEINIGLGQKIKCRFSGSVSLKESTWHPEFGRAIPNRKIEVALVNCQLTTNFEFCEETR